MKIFCAAILLISFSLNFMSCSPSGSDDIDRFISADKTNILVSSIGGKDSIIIHSNIAWTIAGIPNWIHTNITSGNAGDNKLVIVVDENKGTQPLTADITISGTDVAPAVIKVTQSGTQPFLTVDKNSFVVSPSGQKDSIIISSNADWTITIPIASSWITADKLSGSMGITKVYFTIVRNSGNQSRSTEVVISSNAPGIQSAKLSFTQQNLSITGFAPQRGPWKTSVTITGNFGVNPIVKLNNIACTVTSNNASQIVFSTPYAMSGKISISFDSTTLITSTDFTVTNTWIKILDKGYSGLGGIIQDGAPFAWNNKIYFGFGLDRGPNTTMNTFGFRIYDPATNQWSQGPIQPSSMGGRTNPGCVLVNNVAYVGLGRYYNFYTDFWSLNPATESWKQLPNFPGIGIYPLCFENQNLLYVGLPTYDTGVIRKYDPLANNGNGSWLKVPVRFPRLQGSLCFTIASYTYIVGGFDSAFTAANLKSTFKFDPPNNSLVRVGDIPAIGGVSQASAASFVLNSKGYVFGLCNLYQYDPANNTWIALDPTFTPCNLANRAALANSELYAWEEDGTVYKYIPL